MFGLESKPLVPSPPHLLKIRIALISIFTMVSIKVFLFLFKFRVGGWIVLSPQNFHAFGDISLIIFPSRVSSPRMCYKTHYKPFTLFFSHFENN